MTLKKYSVTALIFAIITAPISALAQNKSPVTPENLRPSASVLIDCKDAPVGAITSLPPGVRKWATVYCTRLGQIFSPDDQHIGLLPGSGMRVAIGAADFSGRSGPAAISAHFTKISYMSVSREVAEKLEAVASKDVLGLIRKKPLFHLDLSIDSGQIVSLVVVDPGSDPFWIIPMLDRKLDGGAFYVSSLQLVNRTR